MTPPPDSATAIVWAVFMGCTTPRRLSDEWSISRHKACQVLYEASMLCLIQRTSRGHYRYWPKRHSRNGTLARHRAMLRDRRFNPLPHLTRSIA